MSEPIDDYTDFGDELSEAEREELLRDRAAVEQVVRQVQGLPRLKVPVDFRARVMAGVVGATQEQPPSLEAEDWDPDQVLAESPALLAVVERLRALPRLVVPRGFLSRILSEIDELELTRQRDAHRERLERRGGGGWRQGVLRLSQAAGFLLLIGLGATWTAPEHHSVTRPDYFSPEPFNAGVSGLAGESVGANADEAALPALPGGPYDAEVELRAGVDLERAGAAVQGVVGRFAQRIEGQRQGGAWGWVIQVRADATDDLYRALAATSEVRVDADDQRALLQVNREQDQVELKNGVIYVGRLSQAGREVVLDAGSVERRFPRQDVLDTRSAGDLRRVRIDLRR
ncbi:MAG: hypothetical protein R3F62_15255 [Planctomycetota bacterium]